MAQPVEQMMFERKFTNRSDHGSLLCAHKRRGFGKAGGRFGKNTTAFMLVKIDSIGVQREDNWAKSAGRNNRYRGIFPCFLRGFVSFLFSSDRKALMILVRVSAGSMTASM